MASMVIFGETIFWPEFKPVYEIVKVEQDVIFIIPHIWNNENVDAQIETYVCHVCTSFDKPISSVKNGDYKLIFGFKNGIRYEWKLVEYKFSHVGMGGGCICPAIWKYRFKEYDKNVPKKFEITGVPSSSLFDDKAFLSEYRY